MQVFSVFIYFFPFQLLLVMNVSQIFTCDRGCHGFDPDLRGVLGGVAQFVYKA